MGEGVRPIMYVTVGHQNKNIPLYLHKPKTLDLLPPCQVAMECDQTPRAFAEAPAPLHTQHGGRANSTSPNNRSPATTEQNLTTYLGSC